jgi:hypothetical protein
MLDSYRGNGQWSLHVPLRLGIEAERRRRRLLPCRPIPRRCWGRNLDLAPPARGLWGGGLPWEKGEDRMMEDVRREKKSEKSLESRF